MKRKVRVDFCFGNHSTREDARTPVKLLLGRKYDLLVEEAAEAWNYCRKDYIKEVNGYYSAPQELVERLKRSCPDFDRFPQNWTFNFCVGTAAKMSGTRLWFLEGPTKDVKELPSDPLGIPEKIRSYTNEAGDALQDGHSQKVIDMTRDFLVFMAELAILRDASFIANFPSMPEEAEEFYQTKFGDELTVLVAIGTVHSGLADKIRAKGCEVTETTYSVLNPYVRAMMRLANEPLETLAPTESDVYATIHALLFPNFVSKSENDRFISDAYDAIGAEKGVCEILGALEAKPGPMTLVGEYMRRIRSAGLDINSYLGDKWMAIGSLGLK